MERRAHGKCAILVGVTARDILTSLQDRLNQNASQAVTEVRQLLVDEHVEEVDAAFV